MDSGSLFKHEFCSRKRFFRLITGQRKNYNPLSPIVGVLEGFSENRVWSGWRGAFFADGWFSPSAFCPVQTLYKLRQPT
jgi:hypothetical protein